MEKQLKAFTAKGQSESEAHDFEAEANARSAARDLEKRNAKPISGFESNYSKKKAWLASHPEVGGFGFNVPEPKQWK